MSFSSPEGVMSQVFVRPGSTVVDIGAGTGEYSLLASEKVGPEGSVYAVEVQLSHVDSMKALFQEKELTNAHVIWADAELPEGTRLKEDIADVVILTNVLFAIEDKDGLVEEIKRILKAGGKLLVVDWSESFSSIGPQPQHIVSKKFSEEMFERAGFVKEGDIEAGAHHYGMIFSKT